MSPRSKHLSWGENNLFSTIQGPPWVLLRTFHQFFFPGLPSSHGAGPHPSLPLLLPPLPAQFPEEVCSNPHPSTQADQTLPSLPLLSPCPHWTYLEDGLPSHITWPCPTRLTLLGARPKWAPGSSTAGSQQMLGKASPSGEGRERNLGWAALFLFY